MDRPVLCIELITQDKQDIFEECSEDLIEAFRWLFKKHAK